MTEAPPDPGAENATGVPAVPGNPVIRRLRSFGRPPRIIGVDLARGLAVLGMFGAHIGVTDAFDFGEPGSWLDLVNGRSSILFALLAGVSIAILSGSRVAHSGTVLLQSRLRILVRAGLIFAIGGLLEAFGTPIAVILPMYALLFVVALPFLRWRPASLFLLAGALAVVSPVIHALLAPLPRTVLTEDGSFPNLAFWGPYPAIIWIVFVLVGLGIGRLNLLAPRIQGVLLAVGAALAMVGYGLGTAAESALQAAAAEAQPGPRTAAVSRSYLDRVDIGPLFTTEAHSGSSFEVIGSTGFALAILALCLLVAGALQQRRVRYVLYPLASVGAMALTAYSAHVIVLAGLGAEAFAQADNGLYLAFILATLAGCSAWTILAGRGPLERLLTAVSKRAARTVRIQSTESSAHPGTAMGEA